MQHAITGISQDHKQNCIGNAAHHQRPAKKVGKNTEQTILSEVV